MRLTISPLMSAYDSLGNPSANIDPTNAGTLLFNNPVTLTRSPVHNIDDRFLGNIFGEYKILKGLSFRTSFGIDVYKNQRFEYYPRTTSTGFSKKGIAKIQNFGWRDYLWENTLAYSFTLLPTMYSISWPALPISKEDRNGIMKKHRVFLPMILSTRT